MPKIPNFAYLLGLIQAAIAAGASVLAAHQHGWLALIAVVGAVATAVVAYVNSKKAVAAGAKTAGPKKA